MQVKISDSIKYIGVDDKTIDLFESQYLVPNGISYNSYLIVDEKVAIMDTVDKRKTDEWLENLDRELNGRTPDYLVISHLEPDHASNIKVVSEKYPSMKLVGNAKTFSMLPQFFPDFDFADKTVTVKEGDELELGSHKLTFIMAPMVHWPEVMVSYESAEKVLFSADGFGTFGALDAQEDDWACEARRYYFNICGKYGVQVQNLLKKPQSLIFGKSARFTVLYLTKISVGTSVFTIHGANMSLKPTVCSLHIVLFTATQPRLPKSFVKSSNQKPTKRFRLLTFHAQTLPRILRTHSVSAEWLLSHRAMMAACSR